MEALRIVPKIELFDTFEAFCTTYDMKCSTVLVTNQWMYDMYVKPLKLDVPVIFQEKYGKGEPSDEMIDAMAADMNEYQYDCIIAFGGGTIVDICKILSLDVPKKSEKLFMGEESARKLKKLIVIPTTCGTGSEVTNVAIAELKRLKVKRGLATEETYADKAILIPECLEGLPDYVFATSSIDALIHALESYLSPKATPYTEMFSLEAVRMIIKGYKVIIDRGGNCAENRRDLLKDFCLAANYAGIAFGNAGCGAVHALSYAIGGAFHVPHGEANYQFFTRVFKLYQKKDSFGKIMQVNEILADILDCPIGAVYDELEKLLDKLIMRKRLREYGMLMSQIDQFTYSTFENQQRLLNNNYIELTEEDIRNIFADLY